MKTLLIFAALFCLYKVLSALRQRQREAARERQEQERQAEQTRIRQEWQEQQERSREWVRQREALYREQERQRKEQARLAKEQERQAKVLERHETELRKARFEIEQNRADIDFLQERTSELYAQIDYYTLLQAGTVPGSKEHCKYQSKIVTLHNQVHTAENKLRRAEWCKSEAERKVG